jgi:hypothetical protein
VGVTNGVSIVERKAILKEVYEREIPPVFTPNYLAEWGAPGSSARLKKMAETLAAFARNAKRRGEVELDVAISDWEDDLRFLYDKYYVRRYFFQWPKVKLL